MKVSNFVEIKGKLWYATSGGMHSIALSSRIREKISTNFGASSLSSYKDYELPVCGSSQGIHVFSNNQWSSVGLSSISDVGTLFVDSSNTIWCTCKQTVKRLKLDVNNRLQDLDSKFDSFERVAKVNCIVSDSRQNIFFGTSSGIAQYNAVSGTIDIVYARGNDIPCLVFKDSYIIAARADNLIYHHGKKWSDLCNSSSCFGGRATTRCLLVDRRSQVWWGTSRGLIVSEASSWRQVDLTAVGSNEVLCLFEDSNGAIWCRTPEGIGIIENHVATPPEFSLHANATTNQLEPASLKRQLAQQTNESVVADRHLLEQMRMLQVKCEQLEQSYDRLQAKVIGLESMLQNFQPILQTLKSEDAVNQERIQLLEAQLAQIAPQGRVEHSSVQAVMPGAYLLPSNTLDESFEEPELIKGDTSSYSPPHLQSGYEPQKTESGQSAEISWSPPPAQAARHTSERDYRTELYPSRQVELYNSLFAKYNTNMERAEALNQAFKSARLVSITNSRDLGGAEVPELFESSNPTFYCIPEGANYLVLPIPGRVGMGTTYMEAMYDFSGPRESILAIRAGAVFELQGNSYRQIQKGEIETA